MGNSLGPCYFVLLVSPDADHTRILMKWREVDEISSCISVQIDGIIDVSLFSPKKKETFTLASGLANMEALIAGERVLKVVAGP